MSLDIYTLQMVASSTTSSVVAGIHSAGIDISYKFLKTHLYTVYTYLTLQAIFYILKQ